jgi:hypothetical protein
MTRCTPCVEDRLRKLVADRAKKLSEARKTITKLEQQLVEVKAENAELKGRLI